MAQSEQFFKPFVTTSTFISFCKLYKHNFFFKFNPKHKVLKIQTPFYHSNKFLYLLKISNKPLVFSIHKIIMSKFIEVSLGNSKSEIFNVEHIGHLLPAQVGRCDVFLVTKDSGNNYYGYNLETDYSNIKGKLLDTSNVGDVIQAISGRKIVKGSFDVESSLI